MDDYSFSVLKTYKSRSNLSLKQLSAIYNESVFNMAPPVNYLREQKFIKIEPNHALLRNLNEESQIDADTPLVITFAGKGALEAEIKARRQLGFNEIRAWITLGIAVAGFVLSVIALILQSG